jgi:hypothetical protein
MVKYICLIFVSMVLPLNAGTPQQLIEASTRTLLETVLSKATNSIDAEIYRTKNIEQLKLGRKAARDKKDVHLVELYTEMIAECKKTFFERHSIIIPLMSAAISGFVSWRLATWYRIKSCVDGNACVIQP